MRPRTPWPWPTCLLLQVSLRLAPFRVPAAVGETGSRCEAGAKRVIAGVSADFAAFCAAIAADAWIRLPDGLHPVAWFGRLAGALVRRAPLAGPIRAGLAGAALAFILPGAAVCTTHVLLAALASVPALHPLSAIVEVGAIYTSMSLFGLLEAARVLANALRQGDLDAARRALGSLCSRDAAELDATALANGTLGSLAENLSDSVVAPLCYLVCFGLEGAIAYRAINTLDAMIGYHGRYEWLGKAAARLDDAASFIPARITAALLGCACLTLGGRLGMSARRGVRVWWRDRSHTQSPNGGHPMAMAAGLLGVELSKPGHYMLGAEQRPPVTADIDRGIALVRRAGWLAFACTGAAVWRLGLGGLHVAR
jgi:adenosylcobinamide-phosphate synthase